MSVITYLKDIIKDDGGCCLSLIDPFKQRPEEGAKLARASYEAGVDAILVGGSIGAQGELLDTTTKLIKKSVDLPIILYPGNIGTITQYADAIYFMTMINSRDPYFISKVQILGSLVVKKLNLEPIPVTYIVLEPGGAVGWVGDANLIPRNNPEIATACALAGEYMGAHFIVIDSGSGVPSPAPIEIVQAISDTISIPLINAGGIKTPKQAYDTIKNGADGIQIGTVLENTKSFEESLTKIEGFVKAVKKAGKERVR